MENLRAEAEKRKESIQEKITSLDDRCQLKDTELKLLQDELMVKKQTAREQDAEVCVNFKLSIKSAIHIFVAPLYWHRVTFTHV